MNGRHRKPDLLAAPKAEGTPMVGGAANWESEVRWCPDTGTRERHYRRLLANGLPPSNFLQLPRRGWRCGLCHRDELEAEGAQADAPPPGENG